jgi:hypothetical protein
MTQHCKLPNEKKLQISLYPFPSSSIKMLQDVFAETLFYESRLCLFCRIQTETQKLGKVHVNNQLFFSLQILPLFSPFFDRSNLCNQRQQQRQQQQQLTTTNTD